MPFIVVSFNYYPYRRTHSLVVQPQESQVVESTYSKKVPSDGLCHQEGDSGFQPIPAIARHPKPEDDIMTSSELCTNMTAR
jgi:hypothetical protein